MTRGNFIPFGALFHGRSTMHSKEMSMAYIRRINIKSFSMHQNKVRNVSQLIQINNTIDKNNAQTPSFSKLDKDFSMENLCNVFQSHLSMKEKKKYLRNYLQNWIESGYVIDASLRNEIQRVTHLKRKTIHEIVLLAQWKPGKIDTQSKNAFLAYMHSLELVSNQNNTFKINNSDEKINNLNNNKNNLNLIKNIQCHKIHLRKITGWSPFQLNQQIAYYLSTKYPISESSLLFIQNWAQQHERFPTKLERQMLLEQTSLSTYQLSQLLTKYLDPPRKITEETKKKILTWIETNGYPKDRNERTKLRSFVQLSMKQLLTQLELIKPKGYINTENKSLIINYIEQHCVPEMRKPSQEERDQLQWKTQLSRKQLNYIIDHYFRSKKNMANQKSKYTLENLKKIDFELKEGSSSLLNDLSHLNQSNKNNLTANELNDETKEILFEWMKQHPGKQPKKSEREILTRETGLTSNQIYHFIYRQNQELESNNLSNSFNTPKTFITTTSEISSTSSTSSTSATSATSVTSTLNEARDTIEKFIFHHKRAPDRYERIKIRQDTGLNRQQIASIVFSLKKKNPTLFTI